MIEVTQEVYEGLEAVRESGETNMFHLRYVQYLAGAMDYHETVAWIEDNRKLYMQGVSKGFKVKDE